MEKLAGGIHSRRKYFDKWVIKGYFKNFFANKKHLKKIKDDVPGALFTLTIQYEYTQTQCKEGARYGDIVWQRFFICTR